MRPEQGCMAPQAARDRKIIVTILIVICHQLRCDAAARAQMARELIRSSNQIAR
jgi:hypothetical protein